MERTNILNSIKNRYPLNTNNSKNYANKVN